MREACLKAADDSVAFVVFGRPTPIEHNGSFLAKKPCGGRRRGVSLASPKKTGFAGSRFALSSQGNRMQLTTIESVEHWPLQRLIPYTRNARTHDEGQVSLIAGSIVEL